ncbi:HlyC/CorC family transporter [Psychroflexus gondwanensis]|jgi:CBS domain containing-hemolysin-like protein|uniref:Gliding motility-associated transmembrane, CBS domain protein GldE n=1 Tax=Psychroflexus gondwanensis ACAM 44 TaxID=1189619 RepID=N1WMA3_9FLAO|nr:hemolysin family protein [Psychroflexus gondwanensis]EMY80115.1 gliding motility-associated transmembrane, CBS domain protein GldE [Psychroflexus gondwanensis ACAM 44]TXE18427.1 HlyC/CorC family transporter [Psychroflexus gondwanensis]
MSTEVLIIVLCLLLSAFFSGMEIAFVSANKVHIELQKNQSNLIASVLKTLTKKPSKFIATMLVGNNIALVVYGFFMGDLIMNWFESLRPLQSEFLSYLIVEASLFTQTLISTIVILFTAEFLPKVFFQIYANVLLKVFSVPAFIFYYLFSFISSFVIWVSDFILKKIFKIEGDKVQLNFSKVELGDYINQQMETVEYNQDVDSEIQIFQNALQFSEVKAREVMIPRNEIVAVDISDGTQDLVDIFTKTGLSKLLVYKESNDDIVGYIHSFEMFRNPQDIKSILMPVVFVPETMLVKEILNILIKKRKSIAVVVDEYGGTSGMMTVEDIVEELFGEIEDEHDSVVLVEERIRDNFYKFSARLDVDYINEKYKVNLPESENYETLGGMIVNTTEEIPDVGEEVEIDQFKIKILEASSKKIELVSIKLDTSE